MPTQTVSIKLAIRIEELLDECPETLRNQALVDLIAEELKQRVRAGEKSKSLRVT